MELRRVELMDGLMKGEWLICKLVNWLVIWALWLAGVIRNKGIECATVEDLIEAIIPRGRGA